MDKLFELALAFAQVGIGAFGGGLSTLPLIEHQLVTQTRWLTPEGFGQVLALAQITPGPIAINAATLVGYQQAGLAGSLVATASLVCVPLAFVSLVLAALGRAPAEKALLFQRAIAPMVAALLTLAMVTPVSATVKNGVSATALFLVSISLILKVKFFKKYPFLLFLLIGAVSLLLP